MNQDEMNLKGLVETELEVLGDKELWKTLNELWEKQEAGTTSITYPDDPNLLQARAVSQATIDNILKQGKLYRIKEK